MASASLSLHKQLYFLLSILCNTILKALCSPLPMPTCFPLKYPYFITTSNGLLLQTPAYSLGLNSDAIFCRFLSLSSFFVSYIMTQICFYCECLCPLTFLILMSLEDRLHCYIHGSQNSICYIVSTEYIFLNEW